MREDEEESVEDLKEKIEEKEERIEELENLLKRVKADFENYKKKNRGLEEDFKKKGKEEILKKIFDPVDGLRSALDLEADLKKVEDSEVLRGFYEGIESVLKQVEKIFEDQGVKVIDPEEGEDFDPEVQEAIGVKKTDEEKDGKVSEVLQVGYKYNGKVLRHAKVSVYKNSG